MSCNCNKKHKPFQHKSGGCLSGDVKYDGEAFVCESNESLNVAPCDSLNDILINILSALCGMNGLLSYQSSVESYNLTGITERLLNQLTLAEGTYLVMGGSTMYLNTVGISHVDADYHIAYNTNPLLAGVIDGTDVIIPGTLKGARSVHLRYESNLITPSSELFYKHPVSAFGFVIVPAGQTYYLKSVIQSTVGQLTLTPKYTHSLSAIKIQ